jgi:hypothetical protein
MHATNRVPGTCPSTKDNHMAPKAFPALLIFSLLTAFPVNGQRIDTARQTITSVGKDTTHTAQSTLGSTNSGDDFSPGLLFFGLVGIGLTFICIGIGAALAVAALLLVFGLVSAGILSVSVLVGLRKRSFEKGFRIFVLFSSTTVAVCIGNGGSYLMNRIFHLQFSGKTVLAIGTMSGLVGGVTLGLVLYAILKRLTTYFKTKFRLA